MEAEIPLLASGNPMTRAEACLWLFMTVRVFGGDFWLSRQSCCGVVKIILPSAAFVY